MKQITFHTISLLLVAGSLAMNSSAQSDSMRTSESQTIERDGQHDFDFSIGVWKTELLRLVDPLSGSDEWVEYEGTSIVHKIWDGRANMVELDVEGPAGRIEGLSLRLYNPQSRQWSLNYSNSRIGTMSPPVTGEFRDGVGKFFGQITFNERAVFVKFVVTNISPDAWRYEQFFSDDGGKTWEANWIATDTILSGETE